MATSLSWGHVSAAAGCQRRRRLVIFASKLAGLAGMHPYMDRDAMRSEFRSLVLGYTPSGYEAPAERDRRVMAELPSEARAVLVDTLASIEKLPSAETAAAVTVASGRLDGMLEGRDMDEVRTALFTQHGVVGEKGIREKASAASGRDIRTDDAFRSIRLSNDDGSNFVLSDTFDVFIGGRHDGVSTTEDTGEICVTEIKNRVRRHLGAPTYERVQLHAYMAIFKAKRGVLIESFRDERREHAVDFDPAFWDAVLAPTRAFLEGLMREEDNTGGPE